MLANLAGGTSNEHDVFRELGQSEAVRRQSGRWPSRAAAVSTGFDIGGASRYIRRR